MNRVAAEIYARGFDTKPITDSEARTLLGHAAAELNRQQEVLGDPFIRGYLERFPPSRGEKHG